MREIKTDTSTHPLLTVDEVVERLGGVSRSFIYREIAAGRLDAFRFGNRIRVGLRDFQNYIADRRIDNQRMQPKRKHF